MCDAESGSYFVTFSYMTLESPLRTSILKLSAKIRFKKNFNFTENQKSFGKHAC